MAAQGPVYVNVAKADGEDGSATLLECSECGPVAVTDMTPREAAISHLALVHGCNNFEGPEGP
jgi:hypothetical protein